MPGILAGYARTSTSGQQAGMDAQNRDLKAAGCEEIFSEQISAVASRIGSRNFLGQELGGWVTSHTPLSEPPLRVTGAASVRLKERHSMAGSAPETSRSTHCHYLNEASPSHRLAPSAASPIANHAAYCDLIRQNLHHHQRR
jgi:Resolvase, N terminal domain